MESILKDFGVQPVLLLAQAVNFLILLFILNKLLYKPLLRVLDERKKGIAKSLKDTEEIQKQLLKTEEDREKKLTKATEEAKGIINEASKQATQIITEAHEKGKKDIELMVKKGQDSINLEKEQMMYEVKEEIADMVVLALEKVTGKILSKNDQKKLISDTVKGL